MKLLIVIALVAGAACDVAHLKLQPATGEAAAEVQSQTLDVGQEGQYQFSFQTSNGISASEQGALRPVPGEQTLAEEVQGRSTYTSPEGQVIELTYIADENGYRPQGAHLPTSPPIPPEILESLRFIEANPPKPEKN